ncbi:MAG: response regulator [Alphaproteobacteria bacterium]|jgi:two-component system chemotaxis response regulator CheY|nr:response regulator [Alphaproteobacteria bacterium]
MAPETQTISLDRLRVLVVEDQPYMRQIIRQTLERLGVPNVYEAEDGGAGFKITVRMRPDIVFCDIHMEPVGGIQYLHQLRQFKNPEISATPVVFLTADAEEATVVKSRSAKVNGYIVKPTSAAKLKDNINRLLGPVIP